ncbi:uncharacterized protein MONBRDRAFT_38167 [Monosiga brevicollis MX1]|uniref:NAD-dependent epimerase/dehydratase domain-containing protein n=1 Tax=Monosiga brevicollis TaxID=81824 RepID=A9V621_MONBE|nr:uncharacterized protein MONBRDRAFT_38167 [Monosiga brevicollis MX1]EDQ86909.1 predicted protein [Monosiga brevicollis MX1]|eukprot:XP_001748148.1 hypothetical protein [Monosiga brevicollis MX1]
MSNAAALHAIRSSVAATGPGGRSSVSGIVATVFGSTGFLGRYVVNRLGGTGSQVVLPYRGDEHDWRHLRVTGDLGQTHFLPFQLLDRASVEKAMKYSDVVINLIGQSCDSRHFALSDVHVEGARIIGEAAAASGVETLIHVSSMNADADSECDFYKTKALGEEAVRSAFPDAIIVRPSDVIGFEDRFLNRFAEWRSFPLTGQPLFDGGKATKRPVFSLDVADGIIAAASNAKYIKGQTLEFFGYAFFFVHFPGSSVKLSRSTDFNLGMIDLRVSPREYTVKELVTFVNQTIRLPNNPTNVPVAVGRAVGRAFDRLPLDPIISEQDVLRLSTSDKLSKNVITLEDFGIEGTTMERVALNWLRRFRKPSQHDDLLDVPH